MKSTETVIDFMTHHMIDTREFSDMELEGVLHILSRCGLEWQTNVDGYRNFQYYALGFNTSINKISKCAIWSPKRTLLTKEEFLAYFSLKSIFDFY